jgi:hypothetical protein
MLRRPLRIVPLPLMAATAACFALLEANRALACESDDDCKAPRVCSQGACVSPPHGSTTLPCDRDVDCGGEDVCDNHQCAPLVITPRRGGFTVGSPAAPSPRDDKPIPGLEITPSKPQPAPATPPPPPPPAAQSSSEQPPPQRLAPAVHPRPKAIPMDTTPPGTQRKPLGFHFDLFAGPGVVATQRVTVNTTGLGFGFDGQMMVGIAQNFALSLRGGGVVLPITSLYYVGPGVFMPEWHWGVTVGMGTIGEVDAARAYGAHVDVPFEYPITIGQVSFLKLGADVGVGVYKGVVDETLRLYAGF